MLVDSIIPALTLSLSLSLTHTHTHAYTHMYMNTRTNIHEIEDFEAFRSRTMGWLRLVGSLKLQVSLAKETLKRDYILQKRPIILRSLLIVATP